MARPITKLELTGFRGATAPVVLELDPTKDLVMLFGENGSGKSTILDAIDVVCNDSMGCLEDISVGQNARRYLCAVGKPPTALRTAVFSGEESWTGTMKGNRVSASGPHERPQVRILRRSKILALVTAQPRQRYDALKRFIDVDVVEESEGTLKKKLADVVSQIDTLLTRKTQQLEQLTSVWEAEGRPGPGATSLEWAEHKCNQDVSQLRNALENLRKLLDAIQIAVEAESDFDLKTSSVNAARVSLEQVQREIERHPGLSAASSVQLIESLSSAKTYIETTPSLDKCPTCQRPIGRDELLSIVQTQLNQMRELRDLSAKQQQAKRTLQRATDNLVSSRAELLKSVKQLQEVSAGEKFKEVADADVSWPDWAADEPDLAAYHAVVDAFRSIHPTLKTRRDDHQRDVSQFTLINELYRGVADTERKATDLERIRSGLKRAYDLIHESRLTFTQRVLDQISGEANRLFQEIHPGEAISLTELSMDPARRSSIEQEGTFHGHSGIPPQAVFSDSHLDTLGFCVWLALAKGESPEDTVILIDDVFSSVDGPHLGRVIDLLTAEGRNFLQIIVATHYRLWWDRCQNAGGIQRIHLGSWTISNGIVARNTPLITRELRHLLEDSVLDRQAISSKTGILLERVLDDLALLYHLRLPRNQLNQYTLGALLDACQKLFSTHSLNVERNITWDTPDTTEDWRETGPCSAFDTVKNLRFIRNQVGCHFNPPGMEIPDVEVRRFGQATVDLVEALTCPNCGFLPTKVTKDGTHLRCSCPKHPVRMTPVKIS